MTRLLAAALCAAMLSAGVGEAADSKWVEIRSAHFTVWSGGNKGDANALLWQLEQIRAAVKAQWPWAQVDLSKRMLVIAAKDEQEMRSLAPSFWETKGAVHPGSVWVSGADQHYMVVRTDLRGDDTATVNPYTNVYFSYVNLILNASFASDLPLWFSRGLSGVLSNTLVRDSYIAVGAPVPWHVRRLQEGGRLRLAQLVSVTRASPEYLQRDGLSLFDAESWAFVHFLMFGENGANAARMNRLAALLNTGVEAKAAFAEALGKPEDFEPGFAAYIQRTLFSYQKMLVDTDVKKEGFAVRPLPPPEAAAGLAVFQVAMQRPLEARTEIDKARKADPNAPDAFLAEAMQSDRDGKREEARAAFRKAADLGSSNPYAHYRAAVLCWPQPDSDTLQAMQKDLSRAIELHASFASAYAALGEVRFLMKQPSGAVIPQIAKAISLEPSSPWHRLTAARVLGRMGNLEEARKAAEAALRLADTDEARQQAQQMLAVLRK